MEFPPVINLVSATFSEMTTRHPVAGTETLNAPQPSATTSESGSSGDQSFSSDTPSSRPAFVGRHLDEKA